MRFGQGQYAESRYAQEVRQTPEEVLDVLPWESREFGEEPEVLINGTWVSMPADRAHPYRLEIHDGSGLWLANLQEWWGGQHSQEANIGDELTFTIEYDNTYAGLLVYPNQVWLRDMYGAVIEQFEMARTEPEQDGDSRYLHVVCRDKLSRLATEVVVSYDVTAADSLTVAEVVSALLALQQRDDPIAIGTIDPAVGDQSALLSAHHTTILGALRQLQAALSKDTAGIMYTDAAGALNWRLRTGWQAGQVITIAGNMTGVRVTKNFDNLVNRLYLYGHGQDEENRLDLTDGGHATIYYDGATIGTYGVRPGVKIDNRVKYGATLLDMAARIVEDTENPLITYDVNVLDLPKTQTPGYGAWEELYIGSDARVVAEDIDVDTTLRIEKIVRNLDNPLSMTVALDTRSKGVGDYFAELASQLDPPLDVMTDADRYPNVARLFGAADTDTERNGDWRHSPDTPDGTMEFWDDDAWKEILAASMLSDDDPEDVSTSPAPGTSVEVSRSDHKHEGAPLSDNDPEAVADTAASGTSDEASRSDHEHVGSELELSDDDPEDVAGAADAGTDEVASRADHAHLGAIIFFATTKAGLATPDAGTLAFGQVTAGDDEGHGYFYDHDATDWICFTHLEVPG